MPKTHTWDKPTRRHLDRCGFMCLYGAIYGHQSRYRLMLLKKPISI